MELFEELGGSRFNVNYMRVGGVLHDLPRRLAAAVRSLARQVR